SAADAITAAALDTIDFPRVVNASYADGARIFIEIGPGASCTRMIDSILAGRPHLARAACVAREDAVTTVLKLLANLHAEGVPLDLSVLYDRPEPITAKPTGPTITLPVGYRPGPVVQVRQVHVPTEADEPVPIVVNAPSPPVTGEAATLTPAAVLMAETQIATIQAHQAYLRFATALQRYLAESIAWQTGMLQQAAAGNDWRAGRAPGTAGILTATASHAGRMPAVPGRDDVPRTLDFDRCMEFARGQVGNVLGPRFA